jgi:hypothetical protein
VKFFLVISILFVIAFSCGAQFRASKARIMLPNAGNYWANHPDLTNWIKANGGQALNFKYGGDLMNLSDVTESNVILGFSLGLLITEGSGSNLSAGYVDLQAGTPLYTGKLLEINALAHLTALGYSIGGIIPPNVPMPPSDRYFVRAWTFGGGPSVQVHTTLCNFESWSFGIGIEYGVTFVDSHPSWRFGYAVPGVNGRSQVTTVSVPGPDVDSMYSYLRFSLIIKGRN